jgi:hypothetical protein
MKLLFTTLIIFIILAPGFNAQSVNLDNHIVNIGDSHESILNQFDPKIYKIITDSSSYPIYSYLYKFNNPKKGGMESIAQLVFINNKINSIQKYWDNGTSRTIGNNELAQKIFNIIQTNGIDRYSLDISTTKFADARSISLKIRPNVKLTVEFNGGNNCILSETTSQQEDTTSGHYVLLYFDTLNIIGKDKIITNEFSSEKEAEAKKSDYDMEYIMKNYLPPQSRIIRFYAHPLTKIPNMQ